MRATPSLLLAALLLLYPGARPAAAQEPSRMTVTGRVMDVHTDAPLAEAIIHLPELKIRTATDSLGNFTLRGVAPGPHRWVIHRLGYSSWEEVVEVENEMGIEVRLLPRPVVLEGITVTVNRLETRRRAVATSVRTVAREEILRSAAGTPLDLLRRAGVVATSCSVGSLGTECAYVRGRLTRVSVVIDEQPAPGGLEQLAVYLPQEIYLIESYGGGSHVRAYTTWFMEQVAKGKARIRPTLH